MTNAASSISEQRPQAAIAILYQGDRFLLQLRDDNPKILYPGHWAFFGGHLEPGESAEQALWRELKEEIGYAPPHIQHFQSRLSDNQIIRHVYAAPLTVEPSALELNEGMDLRLLTIEEVRQGNCYSDRIQQTRPLAQPHHQILLDFLQRGI